ncbi:hypothetical protein [Streptosporangium sp. NPDC001681]|uniref:hypothetical protein n=1 Tax=Streptosporangium sp. NPDC001681 TaxID=3154395 RepID=UPI00331D5B03
MTQHLTGQPHDTQCAAAIRDRARMSYGYNQMPAQALSGLAHDIHTCCGHSLLKSHRLAHGWTVPETLVQLAAIGQAAGLPLRGTADRAWRRWESGHHPDSDYQDRISRLFSTGPVQLGFATDYTHPPGDDPVKRRDALRLGLNATIVVSGALADTEREAYEFTRHSERTEIGPRSIERFHQIISDYGHAYPRHSAEELWHSVLADRRHVAELLHLRMTLAQRRELYIAAAWLSVILAWAAQDRGQVRTSLAYAADARHHAEEAGHDEITAWAWDVEATTLLYDDRPRDALHAAEQGAAIAPAATAAHTRLTGQLARIHARLGHTDPARQALAVLREDAERLPAHISGLFGADAVRAWSVAATSSLWLGHDEQAKRYAQQAMEVYEQAPQLSPTRRAITALDLGIACARLGDPDQAVAYGTLAITVPRLAAAIISRGAALGTVLERTYPQATIVTQYRQSMAGLTPRLDRALS